MTALDDALNSSAPMYAPIKVFANWQELPDDYEVDTSPDSLRDLSNQVGPGGVVVTHSLDDGLPSPVTMTSQNDASGSMKVDLVGRPEQYAGTIGWRTSTEGGSVTTTPVFTFPADILTGDYCIIALEVASSTVTATVTGDWTALGEYSDPTGPVKVFLFGKHYLTGMGVPGVTLSSSVQTAWISSAAYARTASGDVHVDFRVNQVAGAAEGVSQATHTAPSVTLTRRGFVVGVWAGLTANGSWSPTGTDTELQDTVGITGTLDLAVTTTALRYPGVHTVSSTSAVANDDVAMAAIALEVWDRPTMDAIKLFSPFNSDSPYYGWDRDTAPVTTEFGVITEDGTVDTPIFQGQMADIVVSGRTAQMEAVSKTRLDMNRSLTLPVVWANRENCTVDWLATWLLARGGQFAGPAPNKYTRYWNPFYGSVHGSYEGSLSYSTGLIYNENGGPFGLRPPTVVDGPFLLGMEAHQEDLTTHEIRIASRPSFEVLPYLGDTQEFHDQISQTCSEGRLTVWLRGDAVDGTPTYAPETNTAFRYKLRGLTNLGGIQGSLEVGVGATDRALYVGMGSLGALTFFTSSLTLPADGEWHFVGFSWNWQAGTYRFKMDGSSTSGGVIATTDTDPFTTDAEYWATGGNVSNFITSHLPISDLLIDSGPGTNTDSWSTFYPTPEAPGGTVTMRPTSQTIEVIAQPEPVNAWETLAELAQAGLIHYRTNEEDNVEFLPLDYFGETAQMTSTVVMDTEVNAGELNVKSDPTKTRNVVTVEFDQTLADGTISPVLIMSSAIEIPRGVSTAQFYLDTPAAEIHGAANPGSSQWTLTNLTSAQIATPSTIPAATHYMTVNSNQDGSGTVIASNAWGVVAKLIDYDSGTITIQFTNKTPAVAWLANNGDQVPFLNILGYAVRVTSGYVTVRDAGSIGTRRERALDVEIPWIHNRRTANEVAQALVTLLSHPRPEVSVRVIGDPRRKPGQLVTLADSDGTQADGTWRVMSIAHEPNGPQYTQNLALVQVLPPGLWDGPDGWDYSVWGE